MAIRLTFEKCFLPRQSLYRISIPFLFFFQFGTEKIFNIPSREKNHKSFISTRIWKEKCGLQLYCGKYYRNLHLIQIVMKIVFFEGKRKKTFSPCFNLIVIRKRKSQTKLQTNILKYFFGEKRSKSISVIHVWKDGSWGIGESWSTLISTFLCTKVAWHMQSLSKHICLLPKKYITRF